MRILLLLALLASGCAADRMYQWGGYDDALYQHYQNPQERDRYTARLATVIAEAERTGGRVPPGCYAEYGWALYEEGHVDQAVTYFEKERDAWPESRFLMEKLVRNARQAQGAGRTTTPAAAVEGGAK